MNTSIAPWLSVDGAGLAVDFYSRAFRSKERYRLDGEDGSVVAKLSVDGAEFWVSDSGKSRLDSANGNGEPVRMVLTVSDPDTVFQTAIEAGGTVVFPVEEDHGWRLGRLVDPFGLHWEIGRPLES